MAWLATMGWLALASLVFIGLGSLTLGFFPRRRADPLVAFWWGVVVATPFCAAWHLFAPIDEWTALAVSALASVGWWRDGRGLARRVRSVARRRPLVVAAAVLLWVALPAVSLQPLTCIDAGYYFVSGTEWHRAFAAVPGLQATNPLAVFNTGALFLCTLVGVGPFAHQGHLVFNAMLTWWGALLVFNGARALTRRWSVQAFAAVLAAAPALDASLTDRMSCPSADIGVAWLGAAAVVIGLRRTRDALLFIGLAPMFKLSMAPLVIGLGLWRLGTRPWTSPAAVALFAASWLAFTANSVVVSGYPFYPMALARFPVDWALPVALVNEVSAVIRWYAMHDGIAGNDLATRIERMLLMNRAILIPLVMSVSGLVLAVVRRVPLRHYGALGACLIGLVIWARLAPDARFAGALWWVTAATALGTGTTALRTDALLRWTGAVAAVLVLAGDVPWTRWPTITGVRPDVPTNAGDPRRTLVDGTPILDCSPQPGVTIECWTVPNVAVFPEGLRLRQPPDVSKGFVVPPDAHLPRVSSPPKGEDDPQERGE